MSALERLKARLRIPESPQERTDKTDRTCFGSFVSTRPGPFEKLGVVDPGSAAVANGHTDDGFEPASIGLDDEGYPAAACATCGSSRFHRAPGRATRLRIPESPPDRTAKTDETGSVGFGSAYLGPFEKWRCSSCHPPALPPDLTGWTFCGVPGDQLLELPPLPMPPGMPVYLDELLPDPRTAPLGRCTWCQFTAPLTAEGWCGACVTWTNVTQGGCAC